MPFSVASCDTTDHGHAMLAAVAAEPVPATLRASQCSTCPGRSKGLCAVLQGAELSDFASISRTKVLAAARPLVRESERADAVFTVVSGMLKLYKMLPDGRQQITGFAASGDMVGLAFGEAYAYTAETVGAATVCRTSRASLTALMGRVPHMQMRLLAMTSVELTAAQDQILLLGCKNAMERICSFLLALARRTSDRDEAVPTVFLPMQKMDMGAYLGLRPETLSRNFRKLEDAGLITRVSKMHIRLDDVAGLADMATKGD